MRLKLKGIGGLWHEKEEIYGPRRSDIPPDVTYLYEVEGLPPGHKAHIQNLAYPDQIWSIQRFRTEKPYGEHTGSFRTPGAALAALQEEYEKGCDEG